MVMRMLMSSDSMLFQAFSLIGKSYRAYSHARYRGNLTYRYEDIMCSAV